MSGKLAKLENLIGHKFQDLKLLERAVTHRSWAFEQLKDAPRDVVRQAENEAFEFVGDSILGAVIAERLFLKNPSSSEGDLTLMKHSLVNSKTLSSIAAELKLNEFIRIGESEMNYAGFEIKSLMADTFEALIGAVFFDAGYVPARAVISKVYGNRIAMATPVMLISPKTELQEVLAARGLSAPSYKTVKTVRSSGIPPDKIFHIELTCNGKVFFAEGSSIKSAETTAAAEALSTLKMQPKPNAKRTRKK